MPAATAAAEEGSAWTAASDECGLLDAVGATFDEKDFLAGASTPVFVGSALTNFGVRHVLDAVVDLAPAPSPRPDVEGEPRALDGDCSAFVFKVQANMDRAHRDRIAFVRICSGRFERGMVLTCERTGKPFATKYASTVFGAERTTIDVAYPGDVVGLVNATGLNLGDSLYEEMPVRFPPIPRFSPEVFASARPLDTRQVQAVPARPRPARRGGRGPGAARSARWATAIRCWRRSGSSSSRCSPTGSTSSSTCRSRSDSAPYEAIRLTDEQSAKRLREIGGIRILQRGDGELVALFESRYRLQRIQNDEPELTLDHILAG